MFKLGLKSAGDGGKPSLSLARIESLYESGRAQEALSQLQALVRAQPTSARLRVRLADWLVKERRTDDAITELYKLQELLAASGNVLAAISAGLRIMKLDPSFENPLSYVAKVSIDQLKQSQAQASGSGEGPAAASPDTAKPLDIPLLSELTPEELQGVVAGMKSRLLSEGASVFEEGDTSRSLCYVVSGLLEIRTKGKTLDTASAGQCLGEFAFLTGEPRSASLVAVRGSEVLELPYEAMSAVVEKHPRVASVLERMYHGRVLARVLAETPLFASLDAGERHRVAGKFELITVPKGITVVREGSEDGALFLVKRGAIEIRSSKVEGTALGRIGPNGFFGEVSFLTGVPRTANAVTVEDSELLRIDRSELDELASEHPKLLEVLKEFHLDRVMNAVQKTKATRA